MSSKNPTQITPRFEEALMYATQLHRHQRRKGSNVPYLAHLLSVAALVLEDGGTEEEAIAGLLHDAIEDQGGATTRTKIRRRFGETVTAIVDGCTESDLHPKPPWRERKEQYLEKMKKATPSVLRVSLADKLHNGRSLLAQVRLEGSSVWSRFRGGKEGTLWFYRSLLEIYRQRWKGLMVHELIRVVSELERVAKEE